MLSINLNPLKNRKANDYNPLGNAKGKKHSHYLDVLNMGLRMNYGLKTDALNPVDYKKPGILGDTMRPEFDVARSLYSGVIGAHGASAMHKQAEMRSKYLSTTSQ